jgi:hypothetical protein
LASAERQLVRSRERRSALADEDERRRRVLPLKPAQRSQLVALDRMGTRRPGPQRARHGRERAESGNLRVAGLIGEGGVGTGRLIAAASKRFFCSISLRGHWLEV